MDCRLCEIVIFSDIPAQMFTHFSFLGKQVGKQFRKLSSNTYQLTQFGR